MSTRRGMIGVQMHGVKLNLSCDYEKQLEHTAGLLGPLTCAPWAEPDLESECTWSLPSTSSELDRKAFDVSGLEQYGKRMHVGEDEVVWSDTHRDRNLQLRFRRVGRKPVFDVAYGFLPSTKKLAKYPDFEQKKFFDLVRYTVLFPIAWHLRRTRHWELIHASCVVEGDRAVLLAGPGGAGKTTTCVALMAQAGMRLMTENLALCDGEVVYPVCEPIRLTDESLELLGPAADQLQPLEFGGLKHKAMFVPPIEANPPGVRAAKVFLNRFSDRSYVRRIPPRLAHQAIVATNVLTLELNDFYWYTAALDLLWPELRPGAPQSLLHLTQNTPCYTLGIDRSRGTRPVVEEILACLRGSSVLEKEPT
jgi:hypothetical protein